MMRAFDSTTRLIDLTVGDLVELVGDIVKGAAKDEKPAAPRHEGRKVYGIAGIAQLFGCSMTTAGRIKRSGKIDRAIRQIGRTIVVDADKALEMYGESPDDL